MAGTRPAAKKFDDLECTVDGTRRARVALRGLQTLWVNTGTLCNLACASCYIESSPRNDSLAFFTRADLRGYLSEITRDRLPTGLVGFTGGEPFVNPDLLPMIEDVLSVPQLPGLRVLVLTNAMRPMRRVEAGLMSLQARFAARLVLRVSLDHYAAPVHERERGSGSWAVTMDGLDWLARHGFTVHVASRLLSGETEPQLRAGYAALFAARSLPVDATDPEALTVFPEMDASAEAPEITEACWGLLGCSPDTMMCASSRMVVRRRGASSASVVACTLIPHDLRFELGTTLRQAAGTVPLAHPHCARFCVLGGGSCTGGASGPHA